jgi:hypothetical protein
MYNTKQCKRNSTMATLSATKLKRKRRSDNVTNTDADVNADTDNTALTSRDFHGTPDDCVIRVDNVATTADTATKTQRNNPSTPDVPTSNPFLQFHQARNNGNTPNDTYDDDDELLNHILLLTNDNDTGTFLSKNRIEYVDSDWYKRLQFIIQYLSSSTNASTKTNHLLSTTEIIQILLPWCLSYIQQQRQRDDSVLIVWEAMNISISLLKQQQSSDNELTMNSCFSSNNHNLSNHPQHNNFLPKILSQSILFKLIPKIAHIAITEKKDVVDETCTGSNNDGENNNMRDSLDLDVSPVVRTYDLLLSLFHPTMDVACKQILIPLLHLHDKHCTPQSIGNQQTISILLQSTILWIRNIHFSRKGNPKTTFQLFSETTIFNSFAQCYCILSKSTVSPSLLLLSSSSDNNSVTIIQDLLWDVFFHPKHHIEGFITILLNEIKSEALVKHDTTPTTIIANSDNILSNPSMFTTYHHELFDSISALFAATNNNVERSIYLFSLLPTLYHGLVKQSNVYRDQRMKRKVSNNSVDLITKIQFQMFVRWTRQLLSLLHSSSSTKIIIDILSCLRQMLQIIFENDIYIPTTIRETDTQYDFLHQIVVQLLDISINENMDWTNQQQEYDTIRQITIQTIQILFQLHHVLLQDRMIDTIKLCLYDNMDGVADRHETGVHFFATMIRTYQQLRQQNYIFNNIFDVVDSMIKIDSSNKINYLQSLFVDPTVKVTLMEAINVCPIEEVKCIFQYCNDWIVQLCSLLNDDKCNNHECMHQGLVTMIPILTMITQSVRVVRATSMDIARCCHILMENAVMKLIDCDENGMIGVVMILTGLLVELHMHCVFWLGRQEALHIPLSILDRLNTTTLNDQQKDITSNLHEHILFLSCHRLKQLHSMIHDQELLDMEDETSTGETMNALMVDAKKRASFLATTEIVRSTKDYRWIAVAQNFSSWIAYAEKHHIIQFLKWVVLVSVKSMTQIQCASDDKQSFAYPASIFNDDEAEVVKFLLMDNAFFQHIAVNSLLPLVGLSVGAEFLSDAVTLIDCTDSASMHLRRLIGTSLTEDGYQRMASIYTMSQEGNSFGKAHLRTCLKASAALQQAKHSIYLVASLPTFSCSDNDTLNFLDLLLRLDQICQSLCSDSDFPLILSIASSIRQLLAKALAGSRASVDPYNFIEHLTICDLLFGSIHSTCNLISCCESIDSSNSLSLMESTAYLVDTLMSLIKFDEGIVERITNGYCRLRTDYINTRELPVITYLSRRLVLSITVVGETIVSNFETLFENMWEVANLSYKKLFNVETINVPEIPSVWNESILFFGDLIRTSRTSTNGMDRIIDEIYSSCVESLRKSKNLRLDISCWNILCYLTGRISVKRPSIDLAISILESLDGDLPLTYSTVILEASLCNMVPTFTDDDLTVVVAKLTEDCFSSHTSTRRLRMLQLLLRNIMNQDKIVLMSSLARKVFNFALSGLLASRRESHWSESVGAACTLLEDIIKKRDFLLFKERDLALGLSYVAGVLGPVGPSDRNENVVTEEEKSVVYTRAAELFVTMFQCYAKQLYVCVPSVISLIHCMLRHIIHNSHLSTRAIKLRSQHFTRICELLAGHKDIYKKHVVGIVLEFVAGVEQCSLSLQCRDALTPAIYFLLDCMSNFEMQQLNAQMNTKARIFFRNIHQNYQKLHTYKGQ